MLESMQIDRMFVAEGLQAMEHLWDAPCRDAMEMPFPDRHRDVLADRKARPQRCAAKFLTQDQLRVRLRDSES